VFATCVREQIDSCKHDAVKEFVAEKDNLKFLFDPPAPGGATGSGSAGTSASAGQADSKDGGCSTSGGAGGLLLVGAAIVGVSRRRRRARD
jgi:uncharacterized protein (TIGR03382 family)